MTNRLPAETFPPGEFLRDELEARGWSQIDLAEILGRPPRLISELIAGKRAITPKTAKGLSEALGTSAQYWMNLESAYQLSRASVPDNTVARKAKLYADYPIREMVKRSWIEPSPSIEVLEQQVHRFFGSPSSGMATIGHAATYEPVETQGETAGITEAWVTNMAKHEERDGDLDITAGVKKHVYEETSCSQCGASFGPGDCGFSHCFQHQKPEIWIAELIRNNYDKAPDLGKAGYKAADDSWDDGADDIARRIIERLEARAAHPRNAAAPSLSAREKALLESLTLVLPMARGYAAAHRVGSNAEYIQSAEQALSAYAGEAGS